MEDKHYKRYEDKIVKLIETFRYGDKKDKKIKFYCKIFETKVISNSRFYQLGLENSEKIKKALEANRADVKADKVDQWLDPDANPTLQLAAYKLMATPEEREALSTTAKVDAKVEGNMGIVVAFEDNESSDKD